MAGYSALRIAGNSTGLVQQREEFLLPDDAYPVLQNAYVWREKILRKKGCELLGRLQRSVSVAGNNSGNFLTGLESTATIVPGSINIVGAAGSTWTDPNSDGVLVSNPPGPNGSVNYATGAYSGPGMPLMSGTIKYYPGLPVMGIRTRELQNSAYNQTIFFDQKYAYIFNSTTNSFQEFIAGTTWNAHNGGVSATDFFWSTNYWTSSLTIPTTATSFFTTTGIKLFWETNNTGAQGALADPPRITDGISWYPFYDNATPANTPWAKIDASTYLVNFLSMLPFRGRLVTFNTWEGVSAASAQNYSNRIRWSTIGNPFIPYANPVGAPSTGSWRDDIRGQGGFLDIPTSEDIVAVGFVRDNLVIYCEQSTWQLRYTGRSISPFQIERVNSELGTASPYGAVQFDTSLINIGDRGIVECDSYKAERIDIKIPNFVFNFQTSNNNGLFRIQGARDYIDKLAYWTIPYSPAFDANVASANRIFPNQRLVYNYENDSWALFDDSFTSLGIFQPVTSRTWLNTKIPWIKCNFSWIGSARSGDPEIVGGNQQGFVEYLDSKTSNDSTLYISAIQANGSSNLPTVITSPNHNLRTGMVIGISGIPTGTPFSNLNGGIFGIVLGDNSNANPESKFRLFLYNSTSGLFNTPQLDTTASAYIGSGLIDVRDNFIIQSKKFNFLDEGQNIQLGFLDILMTATETSNPGAISLYVYLNYDDDNPSNILPSNQIDNGNEGVEADTFFNVTIPTSPSNYAVAKEGSKFWQRVFCPSRANFLTIVYTLSNAQMAGTEQELEVQIDAQVLHIRRAGRMTQL